MESNYYPENKKTPLPGQGHQALHLHKRGLGQTYPENLNLQTYFCN